MDTASFLGDGVGKLAAWCAIFAAPMIFIGLPVFARLHIFGTLDVGNWLILAAGTAYAATMITEIFMWISLFRDFAIVPYIQVFLVGNVANRIIVVCVCIIFCLHFGHVAHQVFCLVLLEKTYAWTTDASRCKRCLCDTNSRAHRAKYLQFCVVRANFVGLGPGSWRLLGV